MAYTRGDDTVEVELARTQSWIEYADKDLYGHNGDIGLVREHRDDRAEKRATERLVKVVAWVCGGGGVASLLHLASEFFHWVPK